MPARISRLTMMLHSPAYFSFVSRRALATQYPSHIYLAFLNNFLWFLYLSLNGFAFAPIYSLVHPSSKDVTSAL